MTPNKITAVLKVTATIEIYDDEASEETVRYIIEHVLEDDGFDVDVALLKEQPEIVRCKNCVHATMTIDGKLCKYCEMETDDDGYPIELYNDADWYCPMGEVKRDG